MKANLTQTRQTVVELTYKTWCYLRLLPHSPSAEPYL
jgi:hypothetical protein